MWGNIYPRCNEVLPVWSERILAKKIPSPTHGGGFGGGRCFSCNRPRREHRSFDGLRMIGKYGRYIPK